MENPKLKRIA